MTNKIIIYIFCNILFILVLLVLVLLLSLLLLLLVLLFSTGILYTDNIYRTYILINRLFFLNLNLNTKIFCTFLIAVVVMSCLLCGIFIEQSFEK